MRPRASRTVTRSTCLPLLAFLAFQSVKERPNESGFRDPVVQRRWTDELRQRLAPHLSRCEGRRVPDNLRACLPTARTAEEVEHRCLR